MTSIIDPLKKESLTTLRIQYNWKRDIVRLEAAKEWESDTDFSQYNRTFCADDILTEDARYLNTAETRLLYRKYGLEDYLDTIILLIKKGKHLGITLYYYSERDIKFVCHRHSVKRGINNRRGAMFIDGIRRYEPEDNELDMIKDGLAISRGMSLKCIAGDISFGGSKSTVQMTPVDLEDMKTLGFLAYALDRNRCMTGADMKMPTEIADVENRYYSMSYTSGPSSPLGESGRPTAYGVFETLKKAVEFKEGKPDLDGKSAVVIGLGAVGMHMAQMLADNGVRLYVSDTNTGNIDKFIAANPGKDIKTADVSEALYLDVDIISPCAVGGIITEDNIEKFKCSYIWGSANNQIKASDIDEEIKIAKLLNDAGIVFQTEWWHNTAGVMCAALEYMEGDKATYNQLVDIIDRTLPGSTLNNFAEAKAKGITPTENAYLTCNRMLYDEA